MPCDVAFRDGYDPASEDRFIELYFYALRHFGPTAATVRLAGPNRGTKLLRMASGVRHLLRELAVYADWDTGGDCFPAEERLAEALAVGRDTVSGWVQDAQSTGWLKVDKPNPRERHGRGWNVNRYTLVLPADIREQAEAHAKARRLNQHAEVGVEQDEPGDPHGARRQSQHAEGGELDVAPEHVGTAPEHVGTTPRARRESTPEDVGKADTTLSVEPIKDPPKDLLNAREDVDNLEEEISRNLDLARLNIAEIHGGTGDDIEIEGHRVGMGIDVDRYKRRCQAGRVAPDIIAKAIVYLPAATGLEPPISLARWDADWSVYEQCVGLVYKELSTIGVTVKTMPYPSGDVVSVEKRKAEQRKQLEQIQREASP